MASPRIFKYEHSWGCQEITRLVVFLKWFPFSSLQCKNYLYTLLPVCTHYYLRCHMLCATSLFWVMWHPVIGQYGSIHNNKCYMYISTVHHSPLSIISRQIFTASKHHNIMITTFCIHTNTSKLADCTRPIPTLKWWAHTQTDIFREHCSPKLPPIVQVQS